ncbi:MAG TPA: class IV adenylate cyclase [Candidatus Acidoferrales bacterium]|nr:class IV adenylate cyclase [Candidatus Acidoferrales bacterium]
MATNVSSKREIEIKLRITDLRENLSLLRHLGAVSHGRVLEQNALFDTPDSSFWRHRRLLRLRTQTPAPGNGSRGGPRTTILTAKAPPSTRPGLSNKLLFKVRLESERTVEEPGRWPRILEQLGFRAGFRYEKYRTSFRLRGLHLDLDETPIGMFLELEGNPGAIRRTARALGFSPKEHLRATYWDLYVANCRRLKRTPGNMVFKSQKYR